MQPCLVYGISRHIMPQQPYAQRDQARPAQARPDIERGPGRNKSGQKQPKRGQKREPMSWRKGQKAAKRWAARDIERRRRDAQGER